MKAWWQTAFVGLLCWGIVTITQYASRGFQAELSSSVNEPAHYVSGAMVAEYLRQGIPGHPMRFAERYYVHYPKVAIGSWPPIFYLLQGVWGVLFGSSKISILLLQGFLLGLGSAVIFHIARRFAGWFGAAALAATYVVVPVSRWLSSMIMAEPLIAIGALGATLAFAAFLEQATFRRALLFAFFVSMTTLTKGTGVAFILVPPQAIAWSRKWRLMVSPALWVAGALVVIAGGVWTLLTLRVVSEGWTKQPGIAYALSSLADGLRFVWSNAGPLPVTLALFGAWWSVRGRITMGLTMLSAVTAVIVFHMIPPIELEQRYYHVVVPMILILAALGFQAVANFIRLRFVGEVLAAVVVVIGVTRYLPVPPKTHYGVDRAAAYLVSNEQQNCAVLLSSHIDIEGMFISEVAFLENKPKHYLIRASKTLATSNWAGTDRQLLFTDASQVHRYLDQSPASLVVTSTHSDFKGLLKPEHTLLTEALTRYPRDWERILSIPSPVNGEAVAAVEIYRHRRKRCVANPHIEVNMQGKLQRTLSN